ncbi:MULTISPECIES: 4-aminobutyrate--2-oxoglutarate transaminase [Yersinia pseudotuberculosis complex]|uniref:4-aminobutyrate transaminase n=1 Tax=Yersinia pseudotuberculosis serotype O:1b (strain IP 31758) TaxID=349747 RepID=A0A0U1R2E7_YERP3|nr:MULTISPECIES: 4-aminobutyrate--2-oxoglutarate transaminase [Yersinia pseudotuberculosis complex]ABS49438.1 4-aminobutyrate transaminase [Yersinia pseudotuberculosis IP 31758]AIN12444.1 4-aminobutyrate transaminase [Yersinia pseudotuberculosis]AJJ05151.1 4-aminobutyrate transaminase [Yersinia pseudotuberculosis]MCE4112295.1 4-aminobutyrate--2-oxoglutarate transaminase [Yersinia pseudotuberculosis]MCF1163047.1 4-aminobutyrate--2-oxoglutarate transaminase [Yersinia pseudotuberculosis]
MSHRELEQRRKEATPRGIGVLCDFYAVRAENATLWDEQGREYIDFTAGIATLNIGHRHPKVMAAVRQQLDQFTHTAYQVVPYASYVTLAEKINSLAPISNSNQTAAGNSKTAFFTTGVEAIENAVKIARAATGRPGVIAFSGAFHGRTLLAMALTGRAVPYKVGFGPFPASIFHALYPNELYGVSVEEAISSVERLFRCDISPTQVAAILFEPIQGEGGFNIAPPEFVSALRTLCDEHGILLIADEVQTGFARTGKLFAMEYYPDTKVDVITMAKSLGGGMPISAVTGRADIMDAPLPGSLGGTYAGNPLAVAASLAVLDIIAEEKLCERALILGAKLVEILEKAQMSNAAIVGIRARGSMVAVEFNDPVSGKPSPELTLAYQRKALEEGLLLLSCGVHSNVIRFLYPLTIPDKQFKQAMNILTRLLAS